MKTLRNDQNLASQKGILTSLTKQLTQAALAAELDLHLANGVDNNLKNSSTRKSIKASAATLLGLYQETATALLSLNG